MVDEIKQKAMKIALIVAGVFFLIAFITNWIEQNFVDGLINGIVGGLIFGGIAFLISKSTLKNQIQLKWWQWIFYVIGWIAGFANILFWLIMYCLHMAHDYGSPFFGKEFHRRVYVWGIVVTFLMVILIPLMFLLI